MADVEVIVKRIEADAQAQAEAIVSQATERANAAVAAAELAAREELAATEDALKVESAQLLSRKKTVAGLEVRKIRLGAYTEAIERAYRAALEQLCALSEADTLALLARLLEAHAEEGDVVVTAQGAPREKIEALPVFAHKNLSLALEHGDFRGGVFLVGKTYDKSLTYESLLADGRTQTESKVLELLGGEN